MDNYWIHFAIKELIRRVYMILKRIISHYNVFYYFVWCFLLLCLKCKYIQMAKLSRWNMFFFSISTLFCLLKKLNSNIDGGNFILYMSIRYEIRTEYLKFDKNIWKKKFVWKIIRDCEKMFWCRFTWFQIASLYNVSLSLYFLI